MIYVFERDAKDGDTFYTFLTSDNVEYLITLSPSFWNIAKNVYEMTMSNESDAIKNIAGYDKCIAPTICAILLDFLTTDLSIAIGYVCESIDRQSRGKARAKLFLKWFDAAKREDFIHLQGITFLDEFNQEYHSDIIFQKDNPDSDLIQENFYTINQENSK